MGPQEDYIETVVTCEGDFHDPQLPRRLECFRQQLKDLLLADTHKPLILKKVEPWNSVRVTFNIPREAALRLKQLAEQGSASLRRLGVLAVQIDGDRLVSLTLATPNNQHAELIIHTHDASAQATTAGPSQASAAVGTAVFDAGLPSSSDELGSPGPSSMEVTRKNIEEYLRQGSLFNSILAPASSSGSDRNGPGSDIFKTPPSDLGPFRPNTVGGSDILAGSSGLANFQQRSQFSSSGSLGSGVGAGAYPNALNAGAGPGGRGSRPALPGQPGLTTALPQTAAVGFNMLGLPPPPPYPHANNVGRQGKKVTASSPLLVNLLQTEPLAGSGAGLNSKMLDPSEPSKPKRKRRIKKKDKQATGAGVGEREPSTLGSPFLPVNPAGQFSNVLKDIGPSHEEMNALINRQTSPPLPLPSPRFGPLNASASVDRGVGDERRVRSPPSASAALAAMAESQRLSDADSSDTIINPYTGQLEPRDSLTDLSPGKKDPHKARKSPSISDTSTRAYSSASNAVPAMTAAMDSEVEAAAIGDPLSVRLDSVLPTVPLLSTGRSEGQPALTVLSSAREVQERNSALAAATASSLLPRAPESESLISRLQDLAHNLVSQSAPVVSSATPNYAQHPSNATQSASSAPVLTSDSTANRPRQTPHVVVPPSPAALTRGQLTVNGPVVSRTSPKTVSAGTSTFGQDVSSSQRQGALPVMYSGNPHPLPSHVQSSVRPTPHRPHPVHNVHNVDGSDGTVSVTTAHEQLVSVTHSDSSLQRPALATDRGQVSSQEVTNSMPAPIPTTSTTLAPSDTLNLLNSTSARLSPALNPAVQQVSADPTSINTASPVGSKALSEGDDNSNHSGIGPDGMADGNTATVALLDGSGAKAYNHDSGLGSASERSDDTPSEPGDGEYHTNAVTSDSTAVEGGKPAAAVVSKGAVNCKTETPGSIEVNTITVGYVHVNERAATIYSKEIKEQPMLKHIAHLSAQQDTSSIASGDKTVNEDPMHGMAHLVKSSGSITSIASQVAMLAGKDSSPALPLSLPCSTVTTESSTQQSQLSMVSKSKGIANCQVTAVHQNGPIRSYSPNQPAALSVPHGPTKPSSPGQPLHHDPQTSPNKHGWTLPLHQNSSGTNSHNDEAAPHTSAPVVPHSVVSASSPVLTAVADSATTSITATVAAKHSHGDSVSHNSAPLPSSSEQANKTGHVADVTSTAAPTSGSSEKGVLSNAVKQHISRLSTSSGNAEVVKSSTLDPGSMPPELIAASAKDSEMDILEATRHLYHSHASASNDDPHSPVFENDDIVLTGDQALTGFMEADVRHSATNGGGGGGVSTDVRAGSNITSIYSKRSSPVNVNMLNHIYAPGLPLPRRLTESVQRLVKPLPASENPLPQARACKSPGASSSRHSSNGSSSPRASQGGARSPGVSTAVTASRMLSYDKGAMSQAGFVLNSSTAVSSVGAPVGYLPSSHPSHTVQDGCSSISVNCCTNATLASSPHLMSSAPSTQHIATTPYTLSSSFPVSTPPHQVPACMYNQPVSSFVSASYPSTVLQPGVQTTAGAAQVSTASTLPATTPLPTSAHHSMVASSSSFVSQSAAESLPHDTHPPRLQHLPRSHSMQGVQNLHPTSSTAAVLHSAPAPLSSQLPHSSAVGNTSSSASSSPAASAEGVSGQSMPTVLRLPSHSVPRPSSGHLVTLCNNLPIRHATEGGLRPNLTVSSAPLAFASRPSHSSPVFCTAASCRSSSSSVTASNPSKLTLVSSMGAVSRPPSDLTTHTHALTIQVSAPSVTTTTMSTTAVLSLTSTTPTASTTKPHTDLGMLTSIVPATTASPTSHQRVSNPSVDSGSGAVLGSVSGTVSSTKVSDSGQSFGPGSSSLVVDSRQQQAAKSTGVVGSIGSSEGETSEVRAKGQQMEVEEPLGRTQAEKPFTQNIKSSETDVPVTQAAESGRPAVPPSLPAVSGSSVQGDQSESEMNSTASSAEGSLLMAMSKQSAVASGASGTESGVGQTTGTESGDAESKCASAVLPEAEVSSEGMQGLQPASSEKPPQLQPPPPPLIPTVVPSATPPPPPLTPVPQELTKQEHQSQAAASHQVDTTPADHATPDKAVTADMVSSTPADLPSQASTTPTVTSAEQVLDAGSKNSGSQSVAEDDRPVDGKPETAWVEDGKSSGKSQTSGGDAATFDGAGGGASTQPSPKPNANQPTSQGMPELSSEETARLRRITRKRKSTQSESDSSEPPQKINSTEGAGGLGHHSRERSSDRDSGKAATNTIHSDQPPKLQREGKRVTAAEEPEKEKEKSSSKDTTHHHERNIIEATPEEVKKLAASSGKRRPYYVYVPEKSLTQSYFDTPVLQGRTRSQSSHTTAKDGAGAMPPSAAAVAVSSSNSQSVSGLGQSVSQPASGQKDEGGEASTSGSKRSTRQRAKDNADPSSSKRKRGKEHR